jgi:hypothetical protein
VAKNEKVTVKKAAGRQGQGRQPHLKARLLNRAKFQHRVADTRRYYSRKHSTVIHLPDDPQKDG